MDNQKYLGLGSRVCLIHKPEEKGTVIKQHRSQLMSEVVDSYLIRLDSKITEGGVWYEDYEIRAIED